MERAGRKWADAGPAETLAAAWRPQALRCRPQASSSSVLTTWSRTCRFALMLHAPRTPAALRKAVVDAVHGQNLLAGVAGLAWRGHVSWVASVMCARRPVLGSP
eukprot:scaffold92031_cov72-Phaeocystis_antarctica.AAC.2